MHGITPPGQVTHTPQMKYLDDMTCMAAILHVKEKISKR